MKTAVVAVVLAAIVAADFPDDQPSYSGTVNYSGSIGKFSRFRVTIKQQLKDLVWYRMYGSKEERIYSCARVAKVTPCDVFFDKDNKTSNRSNGHVEASGVLVLHNVTNFDDTSSYFTFAKVGAGISKVDFKVTVVEPSVPAGVPPALKGELCRLYQIGCDQRN